MCIKLKQLYRRFMLVIELRMCINIYSETGLIEVLGITEIKKKNVRSILV